MSSSLVNCGSIYHLHFLLLLLTTRRASFDPSHAMDVVASMGTTSIMSVLPSHVSPASKLDGETPHLLRQMVHEPVKYPG